MFCLCAGTSTIKRGTPDHGSTIKVSNLQSYSRPAEAGLGHSDAKRPLLHCFADVSESDTAHGGELTNMTYGIPGSSTLRSAAKGSRPGACKCQIAENTNLGELQHSAEPSVFCSTTREGDTRSDLQFYGSTTLSSASNPPNPNLAISERDTRLTLAGSDPRMEGPTTGRSTLNVAFRDRSSPQAPRNSRPRSQHHAPGTPKSEVARKRGRCFRVYLARNSVRVVHYSRSYVFVVVAFYLLGY